MTAHDDHVALGYCDAIEPDSGNFCLYPDDHEVDDPARLSEHSTAVTVLSDIHGDFEHLDRVNWTDES